MDARQKRLVAVLVVVLVVALTAWLWLPTAVDLLPAEIRGRLPDGFVALITTPLPSALPAPLQSADASLLEFPQATVMATTTPAIAAPAATWAPIATETAARAIATRQSPTATTAPRPSEESTSPPVARPLPPAVRLAGLEVMAQKYNNCGPANLAIVLNHYGARVDQIEIGEALKPNYEDRNVSPDELVRFAQEETKVQAMALYGLDLATLKALLAEGYPVIIEKGLSLGPPHGWMGHYLTLVGYDEREGVFYGLDTFLGPWDSSGRSFEFASLEILWAQFNRATIVVFPAALADEVARILGPELLDEQSMWLAAAERARQAAEADPQEAFAWFDVGASLYHLGVLRGEAELLSQSAAAFDRAREIGLPWRTLWYQFEPYLAYIGVGRFDEVLALTEAVLTTSGGQNIEETYLFRGHALMASGNMSGAERAYERALRLNPGFDAARDALEALLAADG